MNNIKFNDLKKKKKKNYQFVYCLFNFITMIYQKFYNK